jgi:mono/diheme cytochrome c family protein
MIESAGDPAARTKILGGHGRVNKSNNHFSKYSILLGCLFCIVGLGLLATPPGSQAQIQTAPRAALPGALLHALRPVPGASLPAAAAQDAGQAAPPAAASTAPKPVDLPEGDGKPIATEFCQDCHRLTNLTKAHKNLDDWKDTIHTMIDRGARVPDEKIDALAQYLTTNFGPKDASAPAAGAATAAPATPASKPDAGPSSVPAAATATVVLPDGDGKAIATENCQACHKLTNLTKAHKSLDDWKDTVQTMIDRGANVPPDKVDVLVQYLAKNFGPKDASSPAAAPAQ